MNSAKDHFKNALTRYINGIHTPEDIDTIIEGMQDKDFRSEIENMMDNIWSDLQTMETDEENKKIYREEARLLYQQLQQRPKRNYLRPLLKYAAIFICVIISGWGIYNYYNSYNLDNITYTTENVKKGEHKKITLPDGTVVILNAATKIKYPNLFAEDTRLVEIDGEAFFEVTPDENKEFIVRTSTADVKVLGTSFNIKAYNEDENLVLTVKTGKVQVDIPDASMKFLANEQLVYNKTNKEYLKRGENPERATAWIHGKLYFNRTPIHSVAQELMRIYNCDIEFTTNVVYEDYIYGDHDNESLEAVLKSIEYSTGIKYRKEGGKIILYKN